jgi:hypothetical protein
MGMADLSVAIPVTFEQSGIGVSVQRIPAYGDEDHSMRHADPSCLVTNEAWIKSAIKREG